MRRALFGGAIASLAGLSAWGVSMLEPEVPRVERSGVVIDTVKRGPMVRRVRGPGKLVPEAVTWISAATEGRVKRLPLLPGVAVEPDTVILELTSPELVQAARTSEWGFKSAAAELASREAVLENEILQLEAGVAKLKADRAAAELEQDVDESLFVDGLVSRRKLRLSRAKVVELGHLISIEEKRLEMKRGSRGDELAVFRARLEQARVLMELRRDQVAELCVVAGTEGVLEHLGVEPGQRVAIGSTLAKVTDPRRLKAVLRIPEVQVGEVALGQRVTVDTRSAEIPGHVVRIDPAVVEGAVAVDVKLDAALPDGARPELSVTGTIEIERLDDVLYVGRPMFGQAESVASLFRVGGDGASAERVVVSFGRSSIRTVEVLDTLVVGDRVITSDMSRWDAFDHIRLR